MGRCCAKGDNCKNCHTNQKDTYDNSKRKFQGSIKIAFAGIPNCGKTTAYNYTTGSSATTGNRPGVTVDVKAKYVRKCILKKALKYSNKKMNADEIVIVDIPGVYSLEAYTPEEGVASDYLRKTSPNVIINVIDATNMERGLFFTYQLLGMGIPIIIALNMMDEAKRRGYIISTEKLSKELGVPVIATVANKGEGLEIALAYALNAIGENEEKGSSLKLRQEKRYEVIQDLISKCVKKGTGSKVSDLIDTVLLNSWFGIPIFFILMIGVFWLTFGPFGTMVTGIFESALNFASEYLKLFVIHMEINSTLTKLINNGILDALTGVFSFIPQIILLFFFIVILEEIGLISRAAFLTDGFMRRFGLGGRSFIPMILGFGCTVPAILSTRTIPDTRDRIVTAISIPFISCGARLPVYGLLAAAFFKEKAYIVIVCLYLLGILATLISAYVFKSSFMKGQTAPLVFELPPYRIPGFRNVRVNLMETAWDFISRLLSTILFASVLMWIFQNFTLSLEPTSDAELSITATLGKFIAPFFVPLGFGDWQRVSALISGLAAKETIIAAFEIIYGSRYTALLAFNIPSALSFMVFVLLYIPCIAAVIALYKELGKKYLLVLSLLWQIIIAWIAAFGVYHIALFIGW